MTAAIEFAGPFGDLVYLLLTAGFFALASGVLRACERIVGDVDIETTTSTDTTASEVVR